MQITGMLHGARLLEFAGFPATEVLGPGGQRRRDQGHDRQVRPGLHQAGVQGRHRQEGQGGPARPRQATCRQRWPRRNASTSREHQVGHVKAKANGVTFEAGVPAKHEVYFSISDSTHFRAPTMTLTHMGGMDIEELDKNAGRDGAVRSAHGPEGLRRGQRADRDRRAEGDHLAAGPAAAQAVGAVPQLRHDHAGAQPDPHARGQEGPARRRWPATSSAASTATTRAGCG